MIAVRAVLVALIVVLAGSMAWFYMNGASPSASGKPYGVAFNLIDHNGDPITEAAFQEKPTALFFGFTHCPEVCPTTLYELDGWMAEADPSGEGLRAFMVTVDPERDSYQLLGQYVSNVSDRIVGISGDPEKVLEMARGFNVYFKKVPYGDEDDYNVDHTASVFLLNGDGEFHGTISYGENPETAVKKLKNLL